MSVFLSQAVQCVESFAVVNCRRAALIDLSFLLINTLPDLAALFKRIGGLADPTGFWNRIESELPQALESFKGSRDAAQERALSHSISFCREFCRYATGIESARVPEFSIAEISDLAEWAGRGAILKNLKLSDPFLSQLISEMTASQAVEESA
jgi:hypothetical protein